MTDETKERLRGGGANMTRASGADLWSDRLSEYLDDELSGVERQQIARHLESCGECRATLDELREVANRAPALAAERDPARDLWPGIARRLSPRRAPWWRRLTAIAAMPALRPRPAFAALAALLVLAAGGAAIWIGTTGLRTGQRQVATDDVTAPVSTTTASREAEAAYDDTVAGLRRIVQENLTADPQVIDVIERNLETLDVAIADYEDALARQPGEERLRERLESARQRKLELLRHAAALAAGADD